MSEKNTGKTDVAEKVLAPRGGGPGARFAEVEKAENASAAAKRILKYFAREKTLVLGMLAVVLGGTVCGVYAPRLQSTAIDIISGDREGVLSQVLALMLGAYLLYSASHLVQGLMSANLSQRIVKRMRRELFDKIVELPVQYLDTHSHGDVMSRMTNDIELQSLPQGLYTLCRYAVTPDGGSSYDQWVRMAPQVPCVRRNGSG